MRRKILMVVMIMIGSLLSACNTTSITCGEGTVIHNGLCVDPTTLEDDPVDNKEDSVSCDDVSGTLFYQADFDELESKFVDNEVGNTHTKDNFVIWGQGEQSTLVNNALVSNGVLTISEIIGTQLNHYYDSGLGYQFFQFETDVNYTVCAIIDGPSGESVTAELGIYYGNGTKDQILLTGDQQLIIQDFKPTISTNTDFGQFVLFMGTLTGDLTVHEIKIVSNN